MRKRLIVTLICLLVIIMPVNVLAEAMARRFLGYVEYFGMEIVLAGSHRETEDVEEVYFIVYKGGGASRTDLWLLRTTLSAEQAGKQEMALHLGKYAAAEAFGNALCFTSTKGDKVAIFELAKLHDKKLSRPKAQKCLADSMMKGEKYRAWFSAKDALCYSFGNAAVTLKAKNIEVIPLEEALAVRHQKNVKSEPVFLFIDASGEAVIDQAKYDEMAASKPFET